MTTDNSINIKAERLAEAVIAAIGTPEPSISDLIIWLEDNFGAKLDLRYKDLSSKPVCGLVYYDAGMEKIKILIDNSDSEERQRFTLCHGIAHIMREQGLIYGFYNKEAVNKNRIERFCNRFAAAFLMSSDIFKQMWRIYKSEYPFLRVYVLAKYFGVSKETVTYRAIELGLSF